MAYPTYAVAKYFVAMALKRHPWTHTKMLQLAINSKRPKSIAHSHYSSLLAGISLEISSASCQKWLCNSYTKGAWTCRVSPSEDDTSTGSVACSSESTGAL